jgi:hypothetical protein
MQLCPDFPTVAPLVASLCLLCGILAGSYLEARAWRAAGRERSGYRSSGRWFDVHPRGDATCLCDLCQHARRRLRQHERIAA